MRVRRRNLPRSLRTYNVKTSELEINIQVEHELTKSMGDYLERRRDERSGESDVELDNVNTCLSVSDPYLHRRKRLASQRSERNKCETHRTLAGRTSPLQRTLRGRCCSSARHSLVRGRGGSLHEYLHDWRRSVTHSRRKGNTQTPEFFRAEPLRHDESIHHGGKELSSAYEDAAHSCSLRSYDPDVRNRGTRVIQRRLTHVSNESPTTCTTIWWGEIASSRRLDVGVADCELLHRVSNPQ